MVQTNIGFTADETLLDHIMALALQLAIHMGTKSYKKLATILSFNSNANVTVNFATLPEAPDLAKLVSATADSKTTKFARMYF